MNKHIVNALSNYNFTFDKNSGYGHIDGYEVNVFNNAMDTGPVFTFSTFLTQSQKNEFVVMMNQRKLQLVQAGTFDFGVMIKIGSMTAKAFEKKFAQVLPAILSILEVLGAPKADICPQSGELIDENLCRLTTLPDANVKVRLSNMAIATVNSSIDKYNEDFQNAPNNYLKGFAGIAIGAVVGVIIAFVCSLLGYVTSFAPLVSIFLGVFLYKKFGGKPNHVMIIMSFLVTVVCILGAILLVYVGYGSLLLEEAGISLSGFGALSYCLENSVEFKELFIEELALNGLFILIAVGVSIANLIKMIRRPKNIN